MMKTVCIIPAFNEEKRIVKVIEGAKRYVDSVIVVDDGSSDATSEVSRKAGTTVIAHSVNRGKGRAIATGFTEAAKRAPDVVILIDADGQHDPNIYLIS
jgi:glycosyltransferase involved in cell wall biosynthesis